MNPPSRRYDRGTRGRISLPASDSSFRYFTSAPTSISSQERSPRLWKSYDEVRMKRKRKHAARRMNSRVDICRYRYFTVHYTSL
jgi:hypothetical protein